MDPSSIKHKVQLGSRAEVKKWADKIGPRSVAAAARYGKKRAVKGQE